MAATFTAGDSVRGVPIRAVAQGDEGAARRLLVVGSMHGEESGGHAVIRALRRARVPAGMQVWTVRTVNPDGLARGRRVNARGVDLNRNFAHRWRGGPRGRYYPGPRPFSEPESRAVRRLIARVRPTLTIWLHQPYGFVVDTPGRDRGLIRGYARRVGLPVRPLPRYRGTVVGWQRARGQRAMVVELGSGAVPAATAARHARAAIAVARRAPAAARAARVEKPPIRWTPIPFGADRRRQMRAYSRRHYGDSSHLLEPRTIVQHYTASDTFSSAFNTFAANAPDPELGERPGVCAHFLIGRDGTIHQLVRLRYRCRHVIGINDTAIGIEHVGRSDAQVMGNARQLRASLRLTRWLQARYGIATRHVIGHAESLKSPFHHERVRRLRTRTHVDFPTPVMRRYRARL